MWNEFLDLRVAYAGYEAPDRAEATRKDQEGVTRCRARHDEAHGAASKKARSESRRTPARSSQTPDKNRQARSKDGYTRPQVCIVLIRADRCAPGAIASAAGAVAPGR